MLYFGDTNLKVSETSIAGQMFLAKRRPDVHITAVTLESFSVTGILIGARIKTVYNA